MAQVTGFPGGGIRLSRNMVILCGVGDPNLSSAADVKAARLGYVYLREDSTGANDWLYRCSTAAVFNNGTLASAASWTAK